MRRVIWLVPVLFIPLTVQAQDYQKQVDAYLNAGSAAERAEIARQVEADFKAKAEADTNAYTYSPPTTRTGLSGKLTTAINGEAPSSTSTSRGRTRGQQRYSRGGSSEFNLLKALSDFWDGIVEGAMQLFGLNPSAENMKLVEDAVAGKDAADTSLNAYEDANNGSVTFSESGAPVGVESLPGFDGYDPIETARINDSVGTPLFNDRGELVGFDRDGDGRTDYDLVNGEFVYNGGSNEASYTPELPADFLTPPAADSSMTSSSDTASSSDTSAPAIDSSSFNGLGLAVGGGQSASTSTGRPSKSGGFSSSASTADVMGTDGELDLDALDSLVSDELRSAYGNTASVGGVSGGGAGLGSSSGGKGTSDPSGSSSSPGRDRRRNKDEDEKEDKDKAAGPDARPDDRAEVNEEFPPIVLKGRVILLDLPKPREGEKPRVDLEAELDRVDRQIKMWREGEAYAPVRQGPDPLEAARDDLAQIDFTRVAVWVIVGDTWQEGEPVRMRVRLHTDVQHVMFEPVPGGLMVARGELFEVMPPVEDLPVGTPRPTPRPGDVKGFHLTQVLVTSNPANRSQ